MSSPITTHVLDLSSGKPATGVGVTLRRQLGDQGWDDLARAVTDADGRVRDLVPAEHSLVPGIYRLDFQTGLYFHRQGVASFYPGVSIHFQVVDPAEHYHVPLLLSPFGYSTYRGS